MWNLKIGKEAELLQYESELLKIEKAEMFWDKYSESSDAVIQGLIVGLLYLSGGYYVIHEKLTVGSLTAFITYGKDVLIPIIAVLNLRLLFAQLKPSLNRMHGFFEVMDEEDCENAIEIKNMIQGIEFQNVSKSFGNRKVLENVSFTINKGDKIAIIGENGSGKSTLINMLLRFMTTTEGNILLDGKKIQDYSLDSYRNLFAVVEQSFYLLQDSIEEIVEYQNRKSGVQTKNLLDFEVGSLLKRENMSWNGGNLSGGERQKVALLKAMIKNSEILILDEATSQMDYGSEQIVYENILRKENNKTVLFVTHKQDYLSKATKILKVQNGTVIIETMNSKIK